MALALGWVWGWGGGVWGERGWVGWRWGEVVEVGDLEREGGMEGGRMGRRMRFLNVEGVRVSFCGIE